MGQKQARRTPAIHLRERDNVTNFHASKLE